MSFWCLPCMCMHKHKGQGRRQGQLHWGKTELRARRLEKGCGKSKKREREREARGVGPYKEQQNTSQTLSCLSVPLTSDPPALTHSLIITYHTFYSHTQLAESDRREDGCAHVENEWTLEKDGRSSGALRSVAQQ